MRLQTAWWGVLLVGSLASAEPAVSGSKASTAAEAAEVKALVDRMQGFYEKTLSFSANFRQEYAYKGFKRVQRSSGKVTFKKPGLMRWEYEKPSPKTFVLAGDKVYALDPEAMTLTRGRIGSNQLSASVTFLWGKGHLADEFSITREPCEKCLGPLLEMVPLKPDPRFQKVKLEVNPKTAQVVKSTVIDPDGSENAINFDDLVVNPTVGEDFFKLDPPAGTQVIDMTQFGAAPGADGGTPAADGGSPVKAPAKSKKGKAVTVKARDGGSR